MRYLLVPLLLLAIPGCDQNGNFSTQQVGSMVSSAGSSAGGLLGGHLGTGSTRNFFQAQGAKLGGLMGKSVASLLSARDNQALNRKVVQSLDHDGDGQTADWHSDTNGAHAAITPTRTHYDTANQLCRDVTTSVTADQGEQATDQTTACKKADGSWELG